MPSELVPCLFFSSPSALLLPFTFLLISDPSYTRHMSFTAAVPATRVPQGASPQTPGLYQFFPYIHTLFYDGDKYHPVPTETPVPARSPTAPTFSFPKNPPVFNNQPANNYDLNRPDRKLYHSSPLDMQQHKPAPSPIRMLSPQAPDFTPLFKLPPKELRAVPIRSPQPLQTTKNKALGIDLGGKELKGSESPLEFTFQTTAGKLRHDVGVFLSSKIR